MVTRAICAGLLFLAGTSVAVAHDALLDQALARTALPVTDTQGMVRTTTTVTGGDEPEVETKTFDPRKEPKKAFASYAELKNVIGPDAHVVSQSTGKTTYAFTTRHVPRGFSEAGNITVSSDGKDDDTLFDGKAEVTTDGTGRPYVSHVDLHMHETAGNIIAKVKRIDISYAFGPAADKDAIAATAMTVDVEVRALFFVHRRARAESTLVASAGSTAR